MISAAGVTLQEQKRSEDVTVLQIEFLTLEISGTLYLKKGANIQSMRKKKC
jgi:hypothetical protein